MQNRGTNGIRKVFYKERSKGNFARENLKYDSIINENVLQSKDSLMHYKRRPSNYLFQLFLKLKGRPEENSSYFSNVQHVQLHVHYVHLLNDRICRYTYVKLTV